MSELVSTEGGEKTEPSVDTFNVLSKAADVIKKYADLLKTESKHTTEIGELVNGVGYSALSKSQDFLQISGTTYEFARMEAIKFAVDKGYPLEQIERDIPSQKDPLLREGAELDANGQVRVTLRRDTGFQMFTCANGGNNTYAMIRLTWPNPEKNYVCLQIIYGKMSFELAKDFRIITTTWSDKSLFSSSSGSRQHIEYYPATLKATDIANHQRLLTMGLQYAEEIFPEPPTSLLITAPRTPEQDAWALIKNPSNHVEGQSAGLAEKISSFGLSEITMLHCPEHGVNLYELLPFLKPAPRVRFSRIIDGLVH